MSKHKEAAESLLVQKYQQSSAQRKLGELKSGVESLTSIRQENISAFDELNSQLDILLASTGVGFDVNDQFISEEVASVLAVDEREIEAKHQISLLEIVQNDDLDWNAYMASVHKYANENKVDLASDPFQNLMTDSQRIEIEKRIDNDLTYKASNCDKYDYMLAVTCGMIGGLVDVIFVDVPGQSIIGKGTDKIVDNATINVAKLFGWQGAREGSDPKSSAIGFLERNFKVNYDQTHSNAPGPRGTDGQIRNLTPLNHHIKSLSHSPDLIGLLFSIINQFTSTSTFISDGRLITIDTETFELQGSNFPAKVFSGFCNWLGHLASDMAGSSGSSGRGTGIPIPFYSLLQFLDFGAFGQHRDTFGKVAVKVFEQGYDLRHGLALAVPVMIAEVLTRISWSFKQRLYHKREWSDCIPRGSNPELRRMLLVSHGTLCMVDGIDAGLRSGGNIIQFMLRANILAWARFGTLAVKELRAWYFADKLDIEAANEHLDEEYKKLLN